MGGQLQGCGYRWPHETFYINFHLTKMSYFSVTLMTVLLLCIEIPFRKSGFMLHLLG